MDTKTQTSFPWLKMDAAGKLIVPHEANETLLRNTVGSKPCNIVSIFGAARQGKSFMMNLLAGQENVFKISNASTPCTQGVDISSFTMQLEAFTSIGNSDPQTYPEVQQSNPRMVISFADAEGQGDRDEKYDARLVCPVLLTSKCVLFNWKNSFQKNSILNLLGVIANAAKEVAMATQDGGTVRTPFAHLHILFRDWNFINTTEEDVYKDLFEMEEPQSRLEEKVRNFHGIAITYVGAVKSTRIMLYNKNYQPKPTNQNQPTQPTN
jgi:hypothetical protein